MRLAPLIIIPVALLLSLSACTQASAPQPQPSTASPAPSTTASSPAPSATPAPPVTPEPTAAPSTSVSASASLSSAATAKKCTSADLKGSLSRNDGAGGTNYFDVELTNVSSAACTLQDYPRVLALDSAGSNTQTVSQVGQDAGHNYWNYRAQAGKTGPKDNPLVKVTPGAKAYFQLSYPSIYNYATGEYRDDPYKQTYTAACGEAKSVAGFLVIPPGEPTRTNGSKDGVYVNDPTGPIPVCFAFKKPYVQVSEFVTKPTTG